MEYAGLSQSLAKRLLSGASWTLASRVVAALAGIGTSALLARMLTADELGVYFMVVSVTIAGALMGQMGSHLSVVRFIAAGMANNGGAQLKPLLRGLLLMVTASGVTIMFLYSAGFGEWLGEQVFHSPMLSAVTGMTALWIALRVMQTLSGQFLRGFHALSVASLFDGALSSAALLSMLCLAWLSDAQLGLGGAIKLSILSFAITACVGMFLVAPRWAALPDCSGVTIGKTVRGSLPLWVSSMSIGGMAEMHLWALSALRPETDVALYGAASRIFVAIGLPLTLINSVAQSTAADLYARGDLRKLEKMMRLTATIAALPALALLSLLVIFAGPFLGLVYGEFYTAAASVLIVLLLGQAINLLTGSPGMLMAMAGRQQALMYFAVTTGLIGLGVTIMSAERFGAAGSAAGLATSLVLQNVSTSIYCWKSLYVNTLPTFAILDDLRKIRIIFNKR